MEAKTRGRWLEDENIGTAGVERADSKGLDFAAQITY